jgi:hypothetical protein
MSDSGWGRGPIIDISSGRPVFNIPRFPRPPVGMLRIGLVGLAVLLLLLTGYYQIEPDQVGVVQRLGAYGPARTSRSRSASRP